jgi:ATP-dependent DNA helicase RecG
MQMGRGEELGSGVLNVNKYLPFYTKGGKPRFIEGDPFVTIIPLPSETGAKTDARALDKSSVASKQKSKQKSKQNNSDRLLELALRNRTVTTLEIATSLGLSRAGVQKIIRHLKKTGLLRHIGPDKGGHWEVVHKQ